MLLIAFAFLTAGGAYLGSNTWSEIVLVLVGCAAAGRLILRTPSLRGPGNGTLIGFAALTALTALSILWSVTPDRSWQEADRLLSLLAVLGTAVLAARLAAERWRALVGGLSAFCVLLSAYALMVKVFAGTLGHDDMIGRLKAPFDYWNATGLVAALGLAPTLWAGARREGGRVGRTLAVPGLAVLLAVLVLSYSRSALFAGLCGTALWFWVVPLRLRGATVLALGVIGGASVSLWALHTHALTADRVALALRTDAGHGFGIVLVIVLGLAGAAGVGAAFMVDRTRLSSRQRRRAGVTLLCLVALGPLGGVVALSASQRGLTGQIAHAWNSLTDAHGVVGDSARRLVDLSNSRPTYWREGLQIGSHSPLHGAGAASYAVARLRFARDARPVGHAHSYPIETFAALGVLGLAVSLALLTAWGRAAARTLRRPGSEAERAGLLTLLCVVVVFGAQSSVDWTWSISGAVVPVLLCVGWLAGRGPLSGGAQAEKCSGRESRRISQRPLLGAACTGVAAAGLLAAWTIWQPLRSADAADAAVRALSRGDAPAALSAARSAVGENPLAVEPLYVLSSGRAALGDTAGAGAALRSAVRLQPQNPFPWGELGRYELARGQPVAAASALGRAHELDPRNVGTASALAQARAAASGASQP